MVKIIRKKAHSPDFKFRVAIASIKADNRVEQALAGPTLSHHRTSDVAYGGFGSVFIEQLT